MKIIRRIQSIFLVLLILLNLIGVNNLSYAETVNYDYQVYERTEKLSDPYNGTYTAVCIGVWGGSTSGYWVPTYGSYYLNHEYKYVVDGSTQLSQRFYQLQQNIFTKDRIYKLTGPATVTKTEDSYAITEKATYSAVIRDIIRVNDYKKTVSAPDGTYPNDGRHSDGFWYVKVGMTNVSPELTINSVDNVNLTKNMNYEFSAIIKDNNVGDQLTLKYSIKKDGIIVSNFENINVVSLSSTGENQQIESQSIAVKDLEYGTYDIEFFASDSKGEISNIVTKRFVYSNNPFSPTIDTFDIVPGSDSVSINYSAYDDNYGLPDNPYNIKILKNNIDIADSGFIAQGFNPIDLTTPGLVVNQAYSTRGNGGRKVVYHEGFVYSAVRDNTVIKIYKTDMTNGESTLIRTGSDYSSTSISWSMAIAGDKIHFVQTAGTTNIVYNRIALDGTFEGGVTLDSSQTALGECSLSVNELSGKDKITACWTSKNSTYPNSFNIRAIQGVISDGLVTWGSVDQITNINTSGQDFISLTSTYTGNNFPYILSIRNSNGTYSGLQYSHHGTSWNDGFAQWLSNTSYAQDGITAEFIPSNIASKINSNYSNGLIVLAWHGVDSDVVQNNIRLKTSKDNGNTWFSFGKVQDKLDSKSISQAFPSLSYNSKGYVFVTCHSGEKSGGTRYDIAQYKRNLIGWENSKFLTSSTNGNMVFPATFGNYHYFDEPITIWQDGDDSSIKISGSLNNEELVKSYQYDELTLNTTYKAILSVKNTLNNVTTKEKYFTTLAEASVINEVSTSSDSLTFKIADNNSYRTGYKVYVNDQYVNMFGEISEQDSEWYRMSIDDASGEKRFTIRGLNPETENRIKIKSRNHEGIETEFSNELVMSTMNVSPSGLVENIVAESTRDTISLAWEPVKYASSYVVKINDVTTEVNINSISIKNGDIAGLDILPNTAYKVSVASKNAVSTTEYSLPVTIKTQLPKPTTPVLEIASTTNNSVNLSWAELSNVNKYELEIDGKLVDMNLDNFYKHNNLVKGSQHTYRIRSYNKDGMSDWSEAIIVKTSHADIVPTLQEGVEKVSEKSVTLSWNPVENATVYYVQKDDGDVLKSNGNVYAIYNGLSPNTEYNFKVYAGDEASHNSTAIVNLNVKTQLLSTPTIENVAEAEMYKIKWHPVEEATSYEIMFDDKVETLITVTDTSYSSSIESLRSYSTVKIRAKNDVGYSSYSNILSVMLKEDIPESPSKLEALSGENFIMIKWQDINPNYYYDLEVDGAVIESIERDKYLHDGLTAFSDHKYRVRSKSDMMEGLWSQFLEIVTLPTKPLPPSNVVIKNTRSTATLSWDQIPSAEGYEVKVNENKIYKLGSQTTYTHRGILLNAEQTYRVRTRNIIGESEWSNLIVNNSLRALCQRDSVIDLGLTASNVDDFSKYTLRVTYNPDVLEVTDLCGYTSDVELEAGIIESEDIEVVEFDEKLIDGVKTGVITFKVSKPVEEGYSWTGILNNIKFKSKLTGITYLTYTVLIDEVNDGGHNE